MNYLQSLEVIKQMMIYKKNPWEEKNNKMQAAWGIILFLTEL